MVVYECRCEICGKEFLARRAKSNPKPKYCSKGCYSIQMKRNWNTPQYRAMMIQKHIDNPTKYWLGKKRPDMTGSKNPNWKKKKGFFIKEGYKILYRPNYKYSQRGGCIPEHRMVWIEAKGLIPKGYEIHHKDENKLNNKLSNLQLLTKSQHMKIHCSFN